MKLKLAVVTELLLFHCQVQGRLKPNIHSLEFIHNQNINVAATHLDLTLLYPPHTLSVPIDHFHNDTIYEPHSYDMFDLRYYFDVSHYSPGGPVIVLASGEASATGRLPFLQKGILAQLAKATHGIGVVLEHRYYGTSFPSPDLSTKNLRFLTTAQALADTAYFAQHVVFEGLEHQNLTASAVPWIAYGGSYAGAFVAFLRVLYPQVFWGAISSSGVVKAIYDYWEYWEPMRKFGSPDCVATTQNFTNVVDTVIFQHGTRFPVSKLKEILLFGNLTHNADFASMVSTGFEGWQDRNWDPAENNPSTHLYCSTVTSEKLLFPDTARLTSSIHDLLTATGYASETRSLTPRMLNWIGWLNQTFVAPCAASMSTQDQCFSNYIPDFYARDDISQTWRSWPYQFCTQWGFFATGSGTPKHQLPLVSRLIDLEYASLVCRNAFNITTPPDVDAVNYLGGYDISYPRLAFIDGQQDPWLSATVHAPKAQIRSDSVDQPFILINGGVHHWDENGLLPNETTSTLPPAPVAKTQSAEAHCVEKWLLETKQHGGIELVQEMI